MNWVVVAPNGLPYTKLADTSGDALKEAARKWRPRLVSRTTSRRLDWLEMKQLGYTVRRVTATLDPTETEAMNNNAPSASGGEDEAGSA